jgi:hypothetical protein
MSSLFDLALEGLHAKAWVDLCFESGSIVAPRHL